MRLDELSLVMRRERRITKDNSTGRISRLCVKNTYILLDVLLCSIAEYFYELCRILASP